MIYILRFSEPIGHQRGGPGYAQFYLGYCKESRWRQRLKDHLTGRGARITQAALEQGRRITVVMTFPGNRKLERRLKRWHSHRRVMRAYANRTGTRIFDRSVFESSFSVGLRRSRSSGISHDLSRGEWSGPLSKNSQSEEAV